MGGIKEAIGHTSNDKLQAFVMGLYEQDAIDLV